ncbi:DUF309 domain-containing protein [Paenibacillus eucommiae]|uniref:Metal-dependent hydrolase n=1 Tax=Paenibacillus eucommiae TaxID=1355755 RepID=A0ABS4J9V3_9BACL|nr:DUF309 domain-containing protein [Paenibacillus eucommiae]MBP1995504.1 putative metal-dependent hydrolase [Paenibacillus eucommiae]
MKTYPLAYTEYVVYFQAERDYFECHEVMEEYWKEHPADEHSLAYVGLIQLAVGLYHQRRGNMAGAVKMLQSAYKHLTDEHLEWLGLDSVELRQSIAARIQALLEGAILYADIDLPIKDPILLEQCQDICQSRGLSWNDPSDCSNEHLIHKHTLRDRSEVIEARKNQILLRQQRKGGSSNELG